MLYVNLFLHVFFTLSSFYLRTPVCNLNKVWKVSVRWKIGIFEQQVKKLAITFQPSHALSKLYIANSSVKIYRLKHLSRVYRDKTMSFLLISMRLSSWTDLMTSIIRSESQGVLSEYVHDVSSYTVVWCQWCAWIIQNETVIFLKIDRKKFI